MRLKVTSDLKSRDGTLTKGGNMKNVLAEIHNGIVKAIKRPGISSLVIGTAMQGQGGIGLNGVLYVVAGDTLRKIILAPPSASTTWAL